MKSALKNFLPLLAVLVLVSNPSPSATPASLGKLNGGIPAAWLVGGIHDGRAGNDIYGVDVDKYLRPNPGQSYLSTRMMGGSIESWKNSNVSKAGECVVQQSAPHSYGWSRGTGYACLYILTDKETDILLRWQQSGISTSGWLDDRPVHFTEDLDPPEEFPKRGAEKRAPLEGYTTEGLVMTAMPEKSEGPRVAPLHLTPGWHRLLVKMVMQNDKGEPFFFSAKFTGVEGLPLPDLAVQTSDPTADLKLNAVASRYRPLVFVDAPANLPRPGETLNVILDMDWHPVREEKTAPDGLSPFRAKLRVGIMDYDGREISVRETQADFPSRVTLDFGVAPEPGYYTVQSSLYAPDGKLIHSFYSDGFTVIRGNTAQKVRLDKKKLWMNNYYIFADNKSGGGFRMPGEDFAWLERSGVYKNIGADAQLNDNMVATFKQAHDRSLVFFGDFSRDGPGNDSPEEARAIAQAVAPYTRYFKCTNEIDIRPEYPVFDKVREPKHWVARAKWEYTAAHQARADAVYVGGSIVRPGDMRPSKRPGILGPGEWFVECLKLGLDKYHDAWDVHAYPQNPPRFGGSFGNGGVEDERGVNAAYKLVGRENKLPFWLGEVGAKAGHCQQGRRGQAELAAKMIAWINSRDDYHGIAFCIGYEYDWARGRLWDYSMGHKPGEAAMITAGALIDGQTYRAVEVDDKNIQAAYFGGTFMIWRTDDSVVDWKMNPEGRGPWVLVDVVGRARPLEVGKEGATFPVGSGPVYVLGKSEFDNLTR